jgi:hypothetical protein
MCSCDIRNPATPEYDPACTCPACWVYRNKVAPLRAEVAEWKLRDKASAAESDYDYARAEQMEALARRLADALDGVLGYAGPDNPDSSCDEARAALREAREAGVLAK